MTGIILGRFQPFHLGHKKFFKEVFDHGFDDYFCIIGREKNTNKLTKKYPFTPRDTLNMIRMGVYDLVLNKHVINYYFLRDLNLSEQYPEYLFNTVYKYYKDTEFTFFANDLQTFDLFDRYSKSSKKHKFKTKILTQFSVFHDNTKPISATEVRQMYINDTQDCILDYIDEKIHKYIIDLKLDQRLKQIYK